MNKYDYKSPCDEHFTLEPTPGLLRVCKESEGKEWIKDGLRAIAELRNQTSILVEDVCNTHKKQ